jgi:Tol biopolymer transport system component
MALARIAFLSWSGSSRGLITASSNGGNEILITNALEDKLPTWNPDSSTILFLSRRGGGRQSVLYCTPVNSVFLSSEPQFVSEGEYPTWSVEDQVIFRG